jgi:phage terminase small subunit
MPTPRKPKQQKELQGTDQACRDLLDSLELPLADELPPPPDWLKNEHARAEWERLGKILFANKLLTEAGLSAFGQLCALHGSLVQLYAAGMTPHASMIATLRGLINDFGLTPVAQGKVRPSGDQPGDNKFATNRRAKA